MAITWHDDEMELVAAGRPDIQKLIRAGALNPGDIDPETGLRKQPKSKFRIRKAWKKDSETGKRVQIELKEHYGHTEDPECKGWRIGLSPDKYWKMLCTEVENRLRGRKDTYAPELTVEETESFEKWLTKKLEFEVDLFDDLEEVDIPRHPVVRKLRQKKKREAKKAAEKKTVAEKPAPKKPGRPKKNPTPSEAA